MNKPTDSNTSTIDIEILSSDTLYTHAELCSICQLNTTELEEYINHGIVVNDPFETLHFRQAQLDRLQRARRLEEDLEINHAGVALALDLLDVIEDLKRELRALQTQ